MMNAHVKDALALCEWASRIENDIQVYIDDIQIYVDDIHV